MKDKSILWLTFGGVAFWLLIGYAPTRTFVVQTAKAIYNTILDQL